MNIAIIDPDTQQTHQVSWNSDKPPTDADVSEILSNIKETVAPESLGHKAIADIISPVTSGIAIGKNIIPAIKSLINSYKGEQSVVRTPAENIEAGIKNVAETAAPVVKAAGIGAIKDIGNIVTHPLERPLSFLNLANIPMEGMAALTKSGIKGIGEAGEIAAKEAATEIPGESIKASKVLAANLNLQPSTLETIANDKEFAKNLGAATPQHIIGTYEPNAIKSVKAAYDGISKAEKMFYGNAGVTDDTKINVLGNIEKGGKTMGGEPNYPIVNLQNKIIDFESKAIGTTEKGALKEAKQVLADIQEKIDKDGNLTFGQTKKMTKALYDMSEDYKTDNGKMTDSAILFRDMGRSLSQAKNSIPEIAKAGSQFSDLENARELFESAFPKLEKGSEEVGIARMIRQYRDERSLEFKNKINQVADTLSKYSESSDLPDFRQDLNRFFAAVDIEKAKPLKVGIPLASKLPVIGGLFSKSIKPTTTTALLGRSGFVNKGNLANAMIKESTMPFIGGTQNTYRALRAILKGD